MKETEKTIYKNRHNEVYNPQSKRYEMKRKTKKTNGF